MKTAERTENHFELYVDVNASERLGSSYLAIAEVICDDSRDDSQTVKEVIYFNYEENNWARAGSRKGDGINERYYCREDYVKDKLTKEQLLEATPQNAKIMIPVSPSDAMGSYQLARTDKQGFTSMVNLLEQTALKIIEKIGR